MLVAVGKPPLEEFTANALNRIVIGDYQAGDRGGGCVGRQFRQPALPPLLSGGSIVQRTQSVLHFFHHRVRLVPQRRRGGAVEQLYRIA